MLEHYVTITVLMAALAAGCTRAPYEEDEEDEEDDQTEQEGPLFEDEDEDEDHDDDQDDQDDQDDDDDGSTDPSGDYAVLEVYNESSYIVTDLYVSPCSASTWGANQLQSPLDPEYMFTLTDIPAGCYDLAAASSDGYWEAYGTDLVGTFTWTLQD